MGLPIPPCQSTSGSKPKNGMVKTIPYKYDFTLFHHRRGGFAIIPPPTTTAKTITRKI